MRAALIALLALALGSTAMADFNGPYLVKKTSSGFVPPAHRYQTVCEVYLDRIVITRGVPGLASREEKKVQLQGNLQFVIGEADKGPIVAQPAPTDGPAEIYFANLILADRIKPVDLGSYTGGDGRRTINQSNDGIALRRFLDLNCQ